MALNDWEMSYNGLTFGGTTDYGLIQIDGLNPPDARIDEIEKAGDHGSFIYAQFLTARTITISGDVTGADEFEFDININRLRAAFAPQTDPQPLSMSIPGGAPKQIICLPTKVQFPVAFEYQMFYETWTVELMAPDPRIYADASSTSDLFPAIANGIGFNLAFNVNFGGTSGGGLTGAIYNNGTFPTLPVVTLYGPINDPILTNQTTGQALLLNIHLGATERLTLDFGAKTIVLGNNSSRYSSLATGSSWWSLQPGANTVQFSGTGIAGSTRASFIYRDAWN